MKTGLGFHWSKGKTLVPNTDSLPLPLKFSYFFPVFSGRLFQVFNQLLNITFLCSFWVRIYDGFDIPVSGDTTTAKIGSQVASSDLNMCHTRLMHLEVLLLILPTKFSPEKRSTDHPLVF